MLVFWVNNFQGLVLTTANCRLNFTQCWGKRNFVALTFFFLPQILFLKKRSNTNCVWRYYNYVFLCSQLNKLSNSVHIAPVDCSFQAVKETIKIEIFIFLPIFWIWRPFWYEKGPIDLCFSNFFQNPRENSFKLVLLTSYLSFHLKSGKIVFCCRFYKIFFVF